MPRLARMRTDSPTKSSSGSSSSGASCADPSNIAVERPRPPELMYQRQASFRSGLGPLAGATPFKRGSRGQLSLRPNDLPSTRERRSNGGGSLLLMGDSSPILEDIELPSSALLLEDNISTTNIRNHNSLDLLTSEDPFSEVASSSGTSSPALLPFNSAASSVSHSLSAHQLRQPLRVQHSTGSEANSSPWDHQMTSSASAHSGLFNGNMLTSYNGPASSLSSFGGPSSLSSLPGSSAATAAISGTNNSHQQTGQYGYRPESLASLVSSTQSLHYINNSSSNGHNSNNAVSNSSNGNTTSFNPSGPFQYSAGGMLNFTQLW